MKEKYENKLERLARLLKEYIFLSSLGGNLNFAKEVDEWLKNTTRKQRLRDNGRFRVGSVFRVLKLIGLKGLDVYFGKSKMQKIYDKHPEMNWGLLKDVPQIVEDPVIILDSATRNDSLVLLGNVYTKNGIPIMIALLVDPKNKTGEIQDYNVISSAYAKTIQKYQIMLSHSKIRYIDPNKNRTDAWLSKLGLQLPSQTTKYGSINKITNDFVNVKNHAPNHP